MLGPAAELYMLRSGSESAQGAGAGWPRGLGSLGLGGPQGGSCEPRDSGSSSTGRLGLGLLGLPPCVAQLRFRPNTVSWGDLKLPPCEGLTGQVGESSGLFIAIWPSSRDSRRKRGEGESGWWRGASSGLIGEGWGDSWGDSWGEVMGEMALALAETGGVNSGIVCGERLWVGGPPPSAATSCPPGRTDMAMLVPAAPPPGDRYAMLLLAFPGLCAPLPLLPAPYVS